MPNKTNSLNPNQPNSNSTPPQSSLAKFKKLDYDSLSQDEQSEGFIFHILSDFVSDTSREKLSNLAKELSRIYPCEIHIHICDDSMFEGMPKWCGNYSAYYRLLIPIFMPKDLKMCLYLDVDMLALKDLRGLWTLNLENKMAGVVQDTLFCQTMKLMNKNPQKADFDFGDCYFNSGFLLINLDEWHKQNIYKKACDFLLTYHTQYHDQDVLNVILHNQCIILPLEYNCFEFIHYPSVFTNFTYYKYKMPYSEEQVKFALENPIILHWAGDGKPYHSKFWRVDTKGEILGLYWWQAAWNIPFFKDDLKALFATKKENYLICKEFGLYIASLINDHSKSLLGYLKMPFVVWRAFKEFDLAKNDDYISNSNVNLDRNLAFELLYIATKAWGRRKQSIRILNFIALPYKIYRAKCRCKKGNLRAKRESVYHQLYT